MNFPAFQSFLLVSALAGSCIGVAQENTASAPLQRERHSAEEQLRFAEGLLTRAFFDMAERELRYFLDQHSDHALAPQAMFRLVEALRAQDKTDATLSAINQFHTRWPQHELATQLFLVKGEMLLRMGRFEQSQSAFRHLLISADSTVREAAVYFLAQSQARLGLLSQARELYNRIANDDFDATHIYRPYALFALARMNQHSNNRADADAAFGRLSNSEHVPAELREEALYRVGESAFFRREFAAAIAVYEQLLTDFPQSAFAREARKRRVWAYLSQEDFTRAAELAASWRRRYPEANDYEMDYIQGAALAGNGAGREAVAYFDRVRANTDAPENYRADATYHLVFNLLRTEQLDRTLEAAQFFQANFPESANRHDISYFAAEAHARQAAHPAAIAGLRQTLTQAPKTWHYYFQANQLLADCYRQAQMWKPAAALFRYLANESDLSQHPYRFLLLAADCELQHGDNAAAIADFERMRQQYANHDEILRLASLRLAELYAAENDYEQAKAVLRQLLAGTSELPKAQVIFFLGYLYFQQDNYAQAEPLLRQALELSGGNGEVARNSKYYLGGTLLKLERSAEALDLFAQLLAMPVELRPVFPTELLFRLAELYYSRNNYETGEVIYRWLATWDDADVAAAGGLGLARLLLVQNKAKDAEAVLEPLLTASRKLDPKPDNFAIEQISSLLGEVYLQTQQHDRAVTAFERALARPGLAPEYAVRARWGLALIFMHENRLPQALHCAVNGFILSNDPIYTPRTMWLAVQILDRQNKPREAWTTWQEMNTRYAAFAQQYQHDPLITKLAAAVATP